LSSRTNESTSLLSRGGSKGGSYGTFDEAPKSSETPLKPSVTKSTEPDTPSSNTSKSQSTTTQTSTTGSAPKKDTVPTTKNTSSETGKTDSGKTESGKETSDKQPNKRGWLKRQYDEMRGRRYDPKTGEFTKRPDTSNLTYWEKLKAGTWKYPAAGFAQANTVTPIFNMFGGGQGGGLFG
jgi:hypothetical protein